jgi:hypothetical protein
LLAVSTSSFFDYLFGVTLQLQVASFFALTDSNFFIIKFVLLPVWHCDESAEWTVTLSMALHWQEVMPNDPISVFIKLHLSSQFDYWMDLIGCTGCFNLFFLLDYIVGGAVEQSGAS